MFNWLKSFFGVPQPTGPTQTLRKFLSSDPTIDQDSIQVQQDGWFIDTQDHQIIRLFEIERPELEQCMVTYRAQMKSEGLKGRAFLEMWCRFHGQREFFSKGFHQPIVGTTNWASYEIPFYLKKRQKPDLIRLNLVIEGIGKIWMRDIELLRTSLAA